VVVVGSNGVAGGSPAELSGPALDFGSLIPGAD
jgi:hypothetical protein